MFGHMFGKIFGAGAADSQEQYLVDTARNQINKAKGYLAELNRLEPQAGHLQQIESLESEQRALLKKIPDNLSDYVVCLSQYVDQLSAELKKLKMSSSMEKVSKNIREIINLASELITLELTGKKKTEYDRLIEGMKDELKKLPGRSIEELDHYVGTFDPLINTLKLDLQIKELTVQIKLRAFEAIELVKALVPGELNGAKRKEYLASQAKLENELSVFLRVSEVPASLREKEIEILDAFAFLKGLNTKIARFEDLTRARCEAVAAAQPTARFSIN